jgi:thymidylate synthase (FAD)
MAHSISPEAEKILDKKFKVLDKGFIRLVDYLGNDERIVEAARVSYGKGVKTPAEDKRLINRLLKDDHTSPFEQVVFTFHVKLPIFVARQWIRHRTARVNEISGRYCVMKDEFYMPAGNAIALQSASNKQGRSAEKVEAGLKKRVLEVLEKGQKDAYRLYNSLIENNIARELARVTLPLSLYTEWYWQIDLHNLFRFLTLRLDPHAQLEIREYAAVMHSMGEAVCPMAFEAFDEHVLHAVKFSKSEMDALRAMLDGKDTLLEGNAYKRFVKKIGSCSGVRKIEK